MKLTTIDEQGFKQIMKYPSIKKKLLSKLKNKSFQQIKDNEILLKTFVKNVVDIFISDRNFSTLFTDYTEKQITDIYSFVFNASNNENLLCSQIFNELKNVDNSYNNWIDSNKSETIYENKEDYTIIDVDIYAGRNLDDEEINFIVTVKFGRKTQKLDYFFVDKEIVNVTNTKNDKEVNDYPFLSYFELYNKFKETENIEDEDSIVDTICNEIESSDWLYSDRGFDYKYGNVANIVAEHVSAKDFDYYMELVTNKIDLEQIGDDEADEDEGDNPNSIVS